VVRSLENNASTVQGLTSSGILVYDQDLQKELYTMGVEDLKTENVKILRGIKQVIFEHIVLLDKYIIYKNFDEMNK